MGGRPYVLNEVAYLVTRDLTYEVAILPWGATEPHNLHLPHGTDTIQVEAIAAETARIATEAGGTAVALPGIPFGANAQQLTSRLTVNLHPSTQARILADVVESLEHHGVPKLLVLNGHGGNDFRQMIREQQSRTSVFLCTADWYTAIPPHEYFDVPGDHAGEMETSLMLHLTPDLVRPLADAGPGVARVFKLEGLRNGLAWAPRDWAQVTADTGVGDPAAATGDKGARFFEAVTSALGEFVASLAKADLKDLYDDPPED